MITRNTAVHPPANHESSIDLGVIRAMVGALFIASYRFMACSPEN